MTQVNKFLVVVVVIVSVILLVFAGIVFKWWQIGVVAQPPVVIPPVTATATPTPTPSPTPTPTPTPESTPNLYEGEYVFSKSDTEALTDAEIDEKLSYFKTDSEQQLILLKIAYDEIVARHGRVFATRCEKEYFDSKRKPRGWYEPQVPYPDDGEKLYESLGDIEKQNIRIIKARMEGIDENWESVTDELLKGHTFDAPSKTFRKVEQTQTESESG